MRNTETKRQIHSPSEKASIPQSSPGDSSESRTRKGERSPTASAALGRRKESTARVCAQPPPLQRCGAPRAPRAPRAIPTFVHTEPVRPRAPNPHAPSVPLPAAAQSAQCKSNRQDSRAQTGAMWLWAGRAPSPKLWAASEAGARSGLRPASASSAAADSRLAASCRPIPGPCAAPPPGPLAPGARGCRRESGATDAPASPVPTAGGSVRQRLDAPGRSGSQARGVRGGPGVGTLAGRGRARVGAGGAERPWAGHRARIGSATRSQSWGSGRPGRLSPQLLWLPRSDGPYFPRLLRSALLAGPPYFPCFQSHWADGMPTAFGWEIVNTPPPPREGLLSLLMVLMPPVFFHPLNLSILESSHLPPSTVTDLCPSPEQG